MTNVTLEAKVDIATTVHEKPPLVPVSFSAQLDRRIELDATNCPLVLRFSLYFRFGAVPCKVLRLTEPERVRSGRPGKWLDYTH
jgi:hypothetical protein